MLSTDMTHTAVNIETTITKHIGIAITRLEIL